MKLPVIALLVIVTCAMAPGKTTPEWAPKAATLATTTEMWRDQYHQAEKCSGKKGDASRMKWYLVPGKDFACPTGRCIGWTDIVDHKMYVASEWTTTAWLFRHEAVHDITGWGHETDKDGMPAQRDIDLWGKSCRAMWGFLEGTPGYVP